MREREREVQNDDVAEQILIMQFQENWEAVDLNQSHTHTHRHTQRLYHVLCEAVTV